MVLQLTALAIFVATFALASARRVHVGILMLPLAFGVGVGLGGMSLGDVVDGFPVAIAILLVGVTYLFSIAQVNGTVDRLIDGALRRIGDDAAVLPFAFFALTAGISAMGAPLSGLLMAPIGMQVAARYAVDPMLMAVAIGNGLSAGAFAPTSLFGIVSYGTAHQAGIDLDPLVLFAIAGVLNLALLSGAYLIFGGRELLARRRRRSPSVAHHLVDGGTRAPLAHNQIATVVCIVALVAAVIAISLAGRNPDIGVLCLALGATLALLDPTSGRAALSRIDWSTVLLVGGIITFVGVLQSMGSVDLLGDAAAKLGVPLLAALAICAIAGLVSAFASTTGILAALVPLALPLVASAELDGWAVISALAVCASIVDLSPFSTTGATLVATCAEADRPRLTSLLTRWAMAMVVVGPVVLVGVLVAPGAL
jgi:di/tricarboxylate transporter